MEVIGGNEQEKDDGGETAQEERAEPVTQGLQEQLEEKEFALMLARENELCTTRLLQDFEITERFFL